MTLTLPLPGGCNCGALRYSVTQLPLTVYICHCHLCQKRTGSAFSMAAVIPLGALEFVSGEPLITERIRNDGRKNTYWLCSSCGTRIHSHGEGAPMMLLRAGTLDDTSNIRPVAQFWTTSAQPWALVADILSYDEQPSDYTPLLAAWRRQSEASSVRSD